MLPKYVNIAVAGILGTSRSVTSVLFPSKLLFQSRSYLALFANNSTARHTAENNRTFLSATMSSRTGLHFSSLDVVSPTIEAVTLNAISGILAQAFTAYKARVMSNSQPREEEK